MWLLVEGGGELDIFAVAENFHSVPRETGAQVWLKREWWTIDDEVSGVSHTRGWAKIFYIAPHLILASKLFKVYLIFSF
jgi:hypothetical protein